MKPREPFWKEFRAMVSFIRGYFVYRDAQRVRENREAGIIDQHEYQQATDEEKDAMLGIKKG